MANRAIERVKQFVFHPPKLAVPTINWFPLLRLLVVGLLLYAVGAFYVKTLRFGHSWAGDFSLYVRHAQNLLEGRSYDDTRFITDPHFPTYSPKAYPPVYPAFLAAVYQFRGLDVRAMKYVGVTAFLAALLLLFVWLRPDIRFRAMLVFLAMVGFHPVFWDFKDMIYADVPFLFFVVAALFIWDRIRSIDRPGWGAAVLGGVAIYLAYGTRSIGLILVPTICLRDLLLTRRIGKTVWRAVGVLAALIVLQGIFFYNDSGYFSLFSWDLRRSFNNAHDYASMAMDLWENGQWYGLKLALFLATGLAAAGGYFLRLRLGARDLEIFIPLYVLAIVFWSSTDGVRYIFPLIPFYFYYAYVGLEGGVKSLPWRNGLFLAWIAASAFTYGAAYAQTNFGPILYNVRSPESKAVFRFIRRQVPEEAVLVVREPRVFALYTGRRFSNYHRGPDDELWNYFHGIRAGYLVTGRIFEWDRDFFIDFAARYRGDLDLVFSNADFRVYRIVRFPQ